MNDEFPTPTRTEPRGEFPVHGDYAFSPLSAEDAKRIARERLENWRREHGRRY